MQIVQDGALTRTDSSSWKILDAVSPTAANKEACCTTCLQFACDELARKTTCSCLMRADGTFVTPGAVVLQLVQTPMEATGLNMLDHGTTKLRHNLHKTGRLWPPRLRAYPSGARKRMKPVSPTGWLLMRTDLGCKARRYYGTR